MKYVSIFFAAAFALIGTAAAGKFLYFTWESFHNCPVSDSLSWDGNLRLIGVHDQITDLRDGNFFRAVFPFLDSPTWPPLRAAISMAVFLAKGAPTQQPEAAVSLVFFGLLFPSLLFVGVRLSRSLPGGVAAGVIAWVCILQTREFAAYSVSAMLETQGMFFALWSAYFLVRLWQSDAVTSFDTWGFVLSAQGLYHTKYPYGVMLFLGAGIVMFVRRPGEILAPASYLWTRHYRGYRTLLLAAFAAVVAALALARHLSLGINNKAWKYVIFLVSIFLVMDISIFAWQRRHFFASILSRPLQIFFAGGVLPAAIWLVIHPNRVASTLGTQLRVQEETRSYTTSLFTQVFDTPAMVWILIAVCLGGYVWIRIQNRSVSTGRSGSPNISAVAAVLGIGIVQFLILEVLTGNKQLRHVYHLLPFVILFGTIIALEAVKPRLVAILAAVLLLGSILYTQGNRNIFGNAYWEKHDVCFTGHETKAFQPARWVGAHAPTNGRTVVINMFHDVSLMTLGRALATDMDVLLRMRAWPAGRIRNASAYEWKNWREFDTLLYVGSDCTAKTREAVISARPEMKTSRVSLIETMVDSLPDAGVCVASYSIVKL